MRAPLEKSLISYSIFSFALINRMNYTSLASGSACLHTCTCEHFPFHFLFPLICSSSRHIFVQSRCIHSCAGFIAVHSCSHHLSAAQQPWEHLSSALLLSFARVQNVCMRCCSQCNIPVFTSVQAWSNTPRCIVAKVGGFPDHCPHQALQIVTLLESCLTNLQDSCDKWFRFYRSDRSPKSDVFSAFVFLVWFLFFLFLLCHII